MSRDAVLELWDSLSERDLDILHSLQEMRLLNTGQIRRLSFRNRQQHQVEEAAAPPEEPSTHGTLRKEHSTEAAAAMAAMRVLERLERLGLVARLKRRIGGVRAGSTGIVWQLGSTGERLLRVLGGQQRRRRYMEPSAVFVDHTVAVAEAAVRLRELAYRGASELLTREAEPECWRAFLTPHGVRSWLKPDLFAITASGSYEDHWFIEVDRATESPARVLRKAHVYERYAATGAHQAEHGLFPVVLWVVPDVKRQQAVQVALMQERGLQVNRFRVITEADFTSTIANPEGSQKRKDD